MWRISPIRGKAGLVRFLRARRRTPCSTRSMRRWRGGLSVWQSSILYKISKSSATAGLFLKIPKYGAFFVLKAKSYQSRLRGCRRGFHSTDHLIGLCQMPGGPWVSGLHAISILLTSIITMDEPFDQLSATALRKLLITEVKTFVACLETTPHE